MIKEGKIIDTLALYQLRHWETKTFHITFEQRNQYLEFISQWKPIEAADEAKRACTVVLPKQDMKLLLRKLKDYSLVSLHEEHLTLEQYFKNKYEECK